MLLPTIYPVTCHTDHVGPGSTFVAIKGYRADGATYIATALEKGASTIVIERTQDSQAIHELCSTYHATCRIVDNARIALAQLASEALDSPHLKLKIIGITGTKGKTTTTYLIDYILQQAGYKTALLSTVVNRIGTQHEPSRNTTPEGDYFQMFLAQCVAQNVDYVVMEVSSHALSLHRTHGIQFAGIGFTNLAPEHMDFYSTLDEYFAAKAQIFVQCAPNTAVVINTNDSWGKKALTIARASCSTHVTSFGQTINEADRKHIPFIAHDVSTKGLNLTLGTKGPLHLSCPHLLGLFNCYNVTMATLLCWNLGVKQTIIAQALQTFPGVPGRLTRHGLKNGAQAFVDYAHNPSSFNEVLKTLRPFTDHLIVVFGCGGNRDKLKRPVMGQLAAHFGDVVIVTNDNPRFEDPATIITEIMTGIPAEQHIKVIQQPDRHKAIATAVAHATPTSIIALLGKGHEPYYLVQGQTFHFDDFEEISAF